MNYCASEEKCITDSAACNGTCLDQNRFKCLKEARCILEHQVDDGNYDCLGSKFINLIP